MNFEMNLQLQLRLMDIPEHNYRIMTFCSILLNRCSLKGGKKRIHHNRLLLLTCAAGFFPPATCRNAVFVQLSQGTFDLAAQYLVSPAMCVCTYSTVDLPHFI